MITSTTNNLIKYAYSLKSSKKRAFEKKFVIEGVHLVSELVESMQKGYIKKYADDDFELDYCLYYEKLLENDKGWQLLKNLKEKKVKMFETSKTVFEKIKDTENSQGILAVVKNVNIPYSKVMKNKRRPMIFLDEIQDPGNLGTIIRSADAAGVGGVFASRGTVDFYNHKTLRSTQGSIFHLPCVKVESKLEFLKKAKKERINVLLATGGDGGSFWRVHYNKPTMLVLGNETHGISKEIIDMGFPKINIPMSGYAESLNVAMAASIILFEAARQRSSHGKSASIHSDLRRSTQRPLK